MLIANAVHYSEEAKSWVAPHPAGGEVYGTSREQCLQKLSEAYRGMAKHITIAAGQLDLMAQELCGCVTLDIPGHDQICSACTSDPAEIAELPF